MAVHGRPSSLRTTVEGKAKVGWLGMLALAGGFAVTLQAQFMGVMTDRIGTAESIFITYGTGWRSHRIGDAGHERGQPGRLVLGPLVRPHCGLLGLVIVGAIGYTVPRLGLVAALASSYSPSSPWLRWSTTSAGSAPRSGHRPTRPSGWLRC